MRADIDAATRQRDRLAPDLHDGIGADVTALILSVRTATRALPSDERRELSQRAQRILDALRQVVRGLRG